MVSTNTEPSLRIHNSASTDQQHFTIFPRCFAYPKPERSQRQELFRRIYFEIFSLFTTSNGRAASPSTLVRPMSLLESSTSMQTFREVECSFGGPEGVNIGLAIRSDANLAWIGAYPNEARSIRRYQFLPQLSDAGT